MSSSSSSTTDGVIQPAQTLSRGNDARSMTTTSSPALRSFHAHVEPAGPPPMTNASQRSTVVVDVPAISDVAAGARVRDGVARTWNENHLEQLHAPGIERRL